MLRFFNIFFFRMVENLFTMRSNKVIIQSLTDSIGSLSDKSEKSICESLSSACSSSFEIRSLIDRIFRSLSKFINNYYTIFKIMSDYAHTE